MAFDYLNDFVDYLAEQYQKMERAEQDKRFAPPYIYLDVLTQYYETVLNKPRFRTQKSYCKETIKKLNPGFYEGYFNSRKKRKNG